MKPFLMDVNLLIALSWRTHVFHSQSQAWFTANRNRGFRTCPITQAGFVRVSSTPSFLKPPIVPRVALSVLNLITELSEHDFWHDDLNLTDALDNNWPLTGHRQVTDAYLIALAKSKQGIIATLDRGLLAIGGTDAVECIL